MGIEGVINPVDIAVSGLRAQSLRIKVIANNIANASSRVESGVPYRRQQVTLSTSPEELNGVTVVEVASDFTTAFKTVFDPGHPDANTDGYVLMPNVDLPVEMMHMVLASRAYQANAAVLKRYQELMDFTLELLR